MRKLGRLVRIGVATCVALVPILITYLLSACQHKQPPVICDPVHPGPGSSQDPNLPPDAKSQTPRPPVHPIVCDPVHPGPRPVPDPKVTPTPDGQPAKQPDTAVTVQAPAPPSPTGKTK